MRLMRLKLKFSPGFTLLELLVVISIIGILITMGSVAFTTAQKKSRDAKRRSDVKAMQNAFEQYYAANSSSYDVCNTMGTSTYLPSGLPKDPKTQANYPCTGSATSYCVCALLEGTNEGNATDSNCTFGTGNYQCLSNLQ